MLKQKRPDNPDVLGGCAPTKVLKCLAQASHQGSQKHVPRLMVPTNEGMYISPFISKTHSDSRQLRLPANCRPIHNTHLKALIRDFSQWHYVGGGVVVQLGQK